MLSTLRFLLLMLPLLAGLHRAQGQVHEFGLTPEMVAKLDTTERVQFKPDGQFCRNALFFGDNFVPKKLRKAGFTEAEVPIMMRWAEEQELPPALQDFMHRRPLGPLFPHYRAYAVRNTPLVWIPKAGNQHMPAALRPVGPYGMLVLPMWRSTSADVSAAAGTPPPPALAARALGEDGGRASASGTTPGGIQYSTADMSEFTNNGSHGTIALYYGYGGTISSAYIFELVGPDTAGNKAALADALAKKVNTSTPFIGFEQRSGKCADAQAAIRQKSGGSAGSYCQGEYRGER